MSACSWSHGWSALLLREYVDEPVVEDPFTTAATPDPLFVLVVEGSCHIESWRNGRWCSARYARGSLAMTPPGVRSTLKWRSTETHRTLQMHLPRGLLARQSQELWDRDVSDEAMPSIFEGRDQFVASTLLALRQGLNLGAPNLYAQTAAEVLGVHVLLHHYRHDMPEDITCSDSRLRRSQEYLHAHLSTDVSLDALSAHAGVSRYHLLRLFKKKFGEPPMRYLTRLRMEEARRLIIAGDISIAQVAVRCGYQDPANFSCAFRRFFGIAPSALMPQRRHGRGVAGAGRFGSRS